MKFGLRGFGTVLLVLSAAPQLALAQRYTDPDTLAPAFPTPQQVVDRMLEIARVKPGETVYDLGCGDGRIVITAAQKFGAKSVGIEIRRPIYEATLGRVAALGLADQVRIVHGNALRTNLSDADVVTLYLLTTGNEKLKPVLERDLRPTTRVVSHNFEIRGWKPVTVEKIDVGGNPHKIFLYVIGNR